MAVDVVVPQLGESISEGEITSWLKADGDTVEMDEILLELETDKTTMEIPSPAAGVLTIVKAEGETAEVGEVIARIEAGGAGAKPKAAKEPEAPAKAETKPAETPARPEPEPEPAPKPAAKEAAPAEPARRSAPRRGLSPAVRRLIDENDIDAEDIDGSGPGGRITKGDVLAYLDAMADAEDEEGPAVAETALPAAAAAEPARPAAPAPAPKPRAASGEPEERVKMSRLRRTIADRLVQAQHTAAILTTFNEIDMSAVMALRSRHKDAFKEKHGISLGFMSFFSRACVLALQEVRAVNAQIDGDEIVYNNAIHLGIAASTDRGLVVPVVRHAEQMNFAELEAEIARLAAKARDNKLEISDLSGGTFTLSNGGVFGSLLSTPILNPPQSGILGMHKIEKRPVVTDGDEIVVRPMMYVALSYDHRLIDGREAVTFLVRVKQRMEDPSRMLLEV